MSQFRLVHAQRALTRVRPTTLPTASSQTITPLTRSFATVTHTSTPTSTSHTPSASASTSTSTSSVAVTRRQLPPTNAAQSSSQANPAFTKTECGLWIDRSLPSNFSKILIANRGEIACRIIRTCRQLGIKTVAVYSDADINAQHVAMADEAYRIGEAPVAKSYLLGPTILEIAKKSGAQAVHPGYGFLSENAHFARQCDAAGIVFIGPPIAAIDAMGSKSASKIIMTKAGVPVVPGYHGDDQSIERLRAEAQKCGYPLMLKAVLGGGGKGMRIVRSHDEFDESLEACKREALASFGDDRVLIERYIVRPRHIEFQVFGDHHGNAVHLYERDCSVQRRHQKVLEEAPAPGMSPEMRASTGASACAAARAVGYVGAGTVEFIFDADTNEYFFMEMNTRLQVEHPVTEMIMHRDLVQWQLHVGYGYPLPVKQEQLHAHGYAIEARVYAENPFNNFLPSTGRLHHLRTPALSPTVRVESGVREGDDVSIFYDPMIAKLVCWGSTREAALANMTSCLEQYQIVGPPNNIPFLLRAVNHPRFRQGMVDTSFIAQNLRDLVPRDTATSSHITSHAVKLPYQHVASLALLSLIQNEKLTSIGQDVWKQTNGFRVNAPATRRVTLSRSGYNDEGEVQLEKLEVDITPQADGRYTFKFADGSSTSVLPVRNPPTPSTRANLYASIDGTLYASAVVRVDADVHVFVHGTQTKFVLPVQSFTQSGAGGNGSVAPMSGKIVKVQTQPKQHVKKGTALVIMEAMKMEHVIRAPKDGIVAAILYKPGEFVEGGKLVVTFEQEKEE